MLSSVSVHEFRAQCACVSGSVQANRVFNRASAEMAHYRASESKREQFRRYLEKAGVLDSLTNVLVALYEETEKPNNALEFIKQHLSAAESDTSEAQLLRLELEELQQKYNQLQEENRELKNRLLQYEPAAEDSGAE